MDSQFLYNLTNYSHHLAYFNSISLLIGAAKAGKKSLISAYICSALSLAYFTGGYYIASGNYELGNKICLGTSAIMASAALFRLRSAKSKTVPGIFLTYGISLSAIHGMILWNMKRV